MIGTSRLIKIIVMVLGIYLLIVNVVSWTMDGDVNTMSVATMLSSEDQATFYKFHNANFTNFKGFEWFFNYLETFPGPATTRMLLSNYSDIVNNYSVSSNGIIDFIAAIWRILSTPLLLVITLVIDVIRNALWFLGAIFGQI